MIFTSILKCLFSNSFESVFKTQNENIHVLLQLTIVIDAIYIYKMNVDVVRAKTDLNNTVT